jgi:ComF family protein
MVDKLLMIREIADIVKRRLLHGRTSAQKIGEPARFPPFWRADCLLCHDPATSVLLCDNCERLLARPAAACPRCGVATPGNDPCGDCLQASPAFDDVVTAFDYRFPMDRLIHRFKFSADLAVGAYLGATLASAAANVPRPDLVVASPASGARLCERGFLPALVLARQVARKLGLSLDARVLRKVRHTPPQTGLDRPSRRRNVAGAFAVDRRLDGLHVAVIDDVMTTGATLAAIATALKEAGAARVSGWVVARTPEPPRGR